MSHKMTGKSYGFRVTTLKNHAQTSANSPERLQRKILPIEATPSIVASNDNRAINSENTDMKIKHQLCIHYILAHAEKALDTRFERGKTSLQGAQEKKGYQAAHGSFIPEPKDEFTKKLAHRIIQNGVTPVKTKPFLKNHYALSSPEIKQLQDRHQDEAFIHKSLEERMPSKNHSSLTNTRFHWNSNATFANPDESNQYDSRLEKKIAPFLKELQDLRLAGDLTPEGSVEQLVEWLFKYHTAGIASLETQLTHIDNLSVSFEKMRAFELTHLNGNFIPLDKFKKYLSDVNAFLESYEVVTKKKPGCPSCAEFKLIRNDFSFLRKLQAMTEKAKPLKEIVKYYSTSRRHLAKKMDCDKESLKAKYQLYLDEAKAQLNAVKDFQNPCVVPNLSKMLFGIMDNGVRRAPTAAELKEQVFKLFALATPVKEKMLKRQREENNENDPSNVKHHRQTTSENTDPVARTLHF